MSLLNQADVCRFKDCNKTANGVFFAPETEADNAACFYVINAAVHQTAAEHRLARCVQTNEAPFHMTRARLNTH